MKNFPRSLFLSHGGGPLPLLGDPQHSEMVCRLQQLAETIPRPDAIAVVSAHWEEAIPTITAARKPELIYDYFGFPPESYEIQYPCPGEPSLASEIQRLFASHDLDSRLDASRGLDHGVFVPLKLMYPAADIPCVQISLASSLDPALHMDVGHALGGLHQNNVLLIGSGFSFHNLRAFFEQKTDESERMNLSFEEWLESACSDARYSEAQRRELLSRWDEAPGGRYCHPREEHLLPLHVCYGAAQRPSTNHIRLRIMNRQASMMMW
jgi:aromatic ring-opening dioxygenase catalytic subunit (LigB family)